MKNVRAKRGTIFFTSPPSRVLSPSPLTGGVPPLLRGSASLGGCFLVSEHPREGFLFWRLTPIKFQAIEM